MPRTRSRTGTVIGKKKKKEEGSRSLSPAFLKLMETPEWQAAVAEMQMHDSLASERKNKGRGRPAK